MVVHGLVYHMFFLVDLAYVFLLGVAIGVAATRCAVAGQPTAFGRFGLFLVVKQAIG